MKAGRLDIGFLVGSRRLSPPRRRASASPPNTSLHCSNLDRAYRCGMDSIAPIMPRQDAPPIASPRAAATLVVVRAAAIGIEVLLLRRAERGDHNSGAWVFPGGVVDKGDRDCHAVCA